MVEIIRNELLAEIAMEVSLGSVAVWFSSND